MQRDPIELVQDGAREALTDAVGLGPRSAARSPMRPSPVRFFRRGAVLYTGLPADLLQRQLYVLSGKSCRAVAHHLAGLANPDFARAGYCRAAWPAPANDLGSDDLLLLHHLRDPRPAAGRVARFQLQVRTAPPASGSVSETNNECQNKLDYYS